MQDIQSPGIYGHLKMSFVLFKFKISLINSEKKS